MNDKALVTIAAGEEHNRFWRVTRPTFQAYADRHGYDLIEAALEPGMPAPSWSKVVRLRELLDEYRLVLWVDCDAAISPDAPDIAAHLEDSHCFQALTLINYRPSGMQEDIAAVLGFAPPLLCTGVWAVQQHPFAARFFDEIWRQTDLLDTSLAEAAPVWRLLGVGEGLEMLSSRPEWLSFPTGTLLLNDRWNSRLVADPSPAHVFHATWDGASDQPDLRVRLLEEFVATGTVPDALLDLRMAAPEHVAPRPGDTSATILAAHRPASEMF